MIIGETKEGQISPYQADHVAFENSYHEEKAVGLGICLVYYCEKIKEQQNRDDTRLVIPISNKGEITEWDEKLNHVRNKSSKL